VLAAALAWLWLLRSPMAPGDGGGGMGGMAMPLDPWSAAYLLPAFLMWAIMMVAMMLPSAAPMILLQARIDKTASQAGRLANTLVFAAAYLLVWAGFSAAAAAGQALLVSAGAVSAAALALGDRTVAAALLAAAALYELTAAKKHCLDKCQSPLIFILRYRRPGAAGALRLGLLHGLFCLGCCWLLMLLLFVGGVMNLAWVAFLGAIVVGEKLAPPAWRAHRWIAALLLVAAAAMLAGA
jgi:predicted metal-binding membrane protein